MYHFLSHNSDLDSIKNLRTHCRTLQDFIQFTSNVIVQPEQCPHEEVELLFRKQKVKAILPVLKFCMRLINEANILTTLHLTFIKNAITLNCPFQCLSVISAQALPFKLETKQTLQFLYYSFTAYYQLQMHEKGYEKLQELGEKLSKQEVSSLETKYLYAYVCMTRLLGRKITQNVGNYLNNLRIGASQEHKYLIQLMMNYGQRKPCKQAQVQRALPSFEKTIFQKCKQDFGIKMRNYAQGYINDSYERVKISDIDEKQLDIPQNMFELNKFRSLGKYDCKEGILYYNHEKITRKEANEMITKCFGLNEAIKKLKDPSIKLKMKTSLSFHSRLLGHCFDDD